MAKHSFIGLDRLPNKLQIVDGGFEVTGSSTILHHEASMSLEVTGSIDATAVLASNKELSSLEALEKAVVYTTGSVSDTFTMFDSIGYALQTAGGEIITHN